ncbi:putative allantoinase 1 [Candida viswanathii]|uniref:Putative allantoinase 1 n=1 Tax=Candida viswanathii TaxID=5486 RepID=A0A367YNE7_9ASCO|nr:putative allantoinase 1 [Candida viswanathii]
MALPSIATLKQLPPADQKHVLDQLFEPCDTLSNFIFIKVLPQDFASYPDFINLVRSELIVFLRINEHAHNSYGEELSPVINEIISAHPRLGEPKKEALSVHSSNEQKTLNSDPEIVAKLKEMNEKYEQRFPGLRYVVFVNGRNRLEILDDMNKRIERGDIKLEREQAFNAMCDIALDRAGKLGVKL